MLTRRQFVTQALKGSSLVAVGSVVPAFIAQTALAAQPGGDNVLVVVELTGGNDGLNTVIPYGDDLYHKARPTLRYEKKDLVRVDDHTGLNPGLRGLSALLEKGQLAMVQGVGYPNPNRSHFESMAIWQSADPRGRDQSGWLGRSLSGMKVKPGHISAFQMGEGKLPLALKGSATGVPSMDPTRPFGLQLGQEALPINNYFRNEKKSLTVSDAQQKVHEKAIRQLSDEPAAEPGSLLNFVQRTSLETYKTVDRLGTILKSDLALPDAEYAMKGGRYQYSRGGLKYNLKLAAQMIQAGLGTRVFYLSLDGFDTHGSQREEQQRLLSTLGEAIQQFFADLEGSGNAKRVVLLTFSEFGRRVSENSSKGTDHGAASCMFLAGPAVRGGLIGKHPSLAPADLADGDLKYRIDFRQVYATLLDNWLAVESRRVLGEMFEHAKVLKV